MNNQPSVAIALLNFNGRQLLERNLPFLTQATYPNKKIIVIDNASADDSVSFLEKNYPDVIIIKLNTNKGFAGGYNEGLQNVQAEYFILINTDVEVTANFVEPMLQQMIDNPKTGICQPKILSLENRDMFEYAGAAGGFIDKYGYTFARGRILDTAERDADQYEEDKEIFWAGGACFMIRASLFKALNGFDSRFFMYSEEVDLCWQAQLSGYTVMYCHKSKIFHRETAGFANQSGQRIYFVFRNNLAMLMKNVTPGERLWLIPLRIFLNIAAALQFLLMGHIKKSFLVLKSILGAFTLPKENKEQNNPGRKPLKSFQTVYKKSILIDYYFRRKRQFSKLDQSKF